MNVCISFNRKYIPYACVMLNSLFKQHEEKRIAVYALNNELTAEDVEFFIRFCEEHGNVFHDVKVDPTLFDDRFPTTQAWTKETLYRLALVEVLPETVDRVLYLDIDIIVHKPLDELYEADFEGNDLIAAPDMPETMPFAENDIRYAYFKNNDMEHYCYVNAGVMLWNLEGMRGRISLQSYMDVAKQYQYQLYALDQDLLNLVHWERIKYVPAEKYNCFVLLSPDKFLPREIEVFDNAAILHYAGEKPWRDGLQAEANRFWWESAKDTPFYVELMEDYIRDTYETQKNSKKILELNSLCQEMNKELTVYKLFYEKAKNFLK